MWMWSGPNRHFCLPSHFREGASCSHFSSPLVTVENETHSRTGCVKLRHTVLFHWIIGSSSQSDNERRHEDRSDVRSPKRQALAKPKPSHAPCQSTTTARAVAALDAAIWTSIVEFLPIPRDLQPDNKQNNDAAVVPVVATWRTLLNLRLVSKELATLLHPHSGAVLWQRLVLQSFDFSVRQGGFNLVNSIDDCELRDPDGSDDDDEAEEDNEEEDDDDEENDDESHDDGPSTTVSDDAADASHESHASKHTKKPTEQNPQLEAMTGRYDDVPSGYLEEDLVQWSKLGIYHRPSQYGFLTTLQQQPSVGEWPATEDPFTLFGDLVRLLHLPHGDDMNAGGECSDTTFKFLAAPAEADASSAYHRFYVMKTLGYVPHFWHWGRGIGKAWKGFTEPDASEAAIKAQRPDRYGHVADFHRKGEFAFPGCSVPDAKRPYRHLWQHCRDWRSVCCNSNSDGYTPVFFVGESKATPHRWTGYAGGKCWT